MLYPEIELIKENKFCSCGQSNFRSVHENYKLMKRVYKIALPTPPYGGTVYYLCEDCINKISKSVNQ